jgi:hypothetical protein
MGPFLSPEWIFHTAAETKWRPKIGVTAGLVVSSQEPLILVAAETNLQSWLHDNGDSIPGSVDEALRVVQSHLNAVIASQGGRAKAQRLVAQLRAMCRLEG